jgi:hypothetical protein
MTDTYKERATMAETIIATTFTLRVPWGSWELGDGSRKGRWHHNPNLSMSAAEQRAKNEANGYECPGTDGLPLPPSPESKP